MVASFDRVYLFVDWHNAQHYVAPNFHKDPRRQLPDALLQIQQQTAKMLTALNAAKRYRVTMRIYHGWHSERNSTPIRRDFEQFSNDVELARTFSKVSFTKGFDFGNEPIFLNPQFPLYSTNRPQGQKMVDTAIVCDLLESLRTDIAQVGIILSDDDDFIPAVMAAHSYRKQGYLLRQPNSGIKHATDYDESSIVRFWREL